MRMVSVWPTKVLMEGLADFIMKHLERASVAEARLLCERWLSQLRGRGRECTREIAEARNINEKEEKGGETRKTPH